jgi:thiol-disulfide isomerase/thioredoxin
MWSEFVTALIVVAVLIVGYYMITGVPPGAKIIEEEPPIANGLEPTQAKFMFFYATWCPHCKHAEQPWHSFKQMVENKGYTYGGRYLNFEEINAETDKGKSALYKIKSYPTFKVEIAEKVYQMSGKPTVDNFRSFLQKTLGSEKSSH